MWGILKEKIKTNDGEFFIGTLFILTFATVLIIGCFSLYSLAVKPKNIESYYLKTCEIEHSDKFCYIIMGNIQWSDDMAIYKTYDKKEAFEKLELFNKKYREISSDKKFKIKKGT